jgi:hypothetical protein
MRGVTVLSPLVRRLCNSTIRTTDSVQLNMTKCERIETQKLVPHGRYCGNASCRTKVAAIFRGKFGIFRSISKLLFILRFVAEL